MGDLYIASSVCIVVVLSADVMVNIMDPNQTNFHGALCYLGISYMTSIKQNTFSDWTKLVFTSCDRY